MDIVQEFIRNIEVHALLRKGDRALVAVSGGIDSVVMLHLFTVIAKTYQLDIIMIHLNHTIRGIESDKDQKFVQDLAAKFNLRIITERVDTPQYAHDHKLSIEQAARILRYDFFERMLKAEHGTVVAVGHNANDQAETFLDRLTRGSGIKGLGSMQFQRDFIIRPMLTMLRSDIESYAKAAGLVYRIDHSNFDKRYKRNRIRHDLIPYLEQNFNPNIVMILNNSSTILKDADLFLELEAKKALKRCIKYHKKNKIILDINQFFEYFKIIQVYVLYYVLTEKIGLSYNLNYEQIHHLLGLIDRGIIGTKYKLVSGWEIVIDRDGLVFRQESAFDRILDVNIGETYPLFGGDKLFYSTIIDKSNFPISFPTSKNIEYIDYELIKFPLSIRSFIKGDRFKPLNFQGEKKVSDFFTDNHVPLHLREEYPILTCKKSIVWIIGMRLDDRYKITTRTKKILKLELKER